MKTVLVFVLSFFAVSFSAAAAVEIDKVQIRCLNWDLDTDSGDASCTYLNVTAVLSNGINTQNVEGEILSSGNQVEDAKVVQALCEQQGYKNARGFILEAVGNTYLKGFFLFSPDLSLQKLVKRRSPAELIGPVLKEFTCSLK